MVENFAKRNLDWGNFREQLTRSHDHVFDLGRGEVLSETNYRCGYMQPLPRREMKAREMRQSFLCDGSQSLHLWMISEQDVPVELASPRCGLRATLPAVSHLAWPGTHVSSLPAWASDSAAELNSCIFCLISIAVMSPWKRRCSNRLSI